MFPFIKIVILMLAMVTVTTSYSMSFQRAKMVYIKIVSSNGMTRVPQLKLVNDNRVNAGYGAGSVVINTGLLRFVRNDAEVALVLGHELAHYTLNHWASTPRNEYAADARGAAYMRNTGYNICTGAQVIKRFNSRGSRTHPPSQDRYKRLCG